MINHQPDVNMFAWLPAAELALVTNQLYGQMRIYLQPKSSSDPSSSARPTRLSLFFVPIPSPLLPSPPPTPFIMGSLSPPPMRHRASSTNLRPALTLATLGPRPKTCTLLDPIPVTPPVTATADIHKVTPSLASPSRLSLLIERCLVLLHVYSHLPPYSTPSSPRSPSEESVLPMSSTA